jgi:hypothetical protein
MVEGAHSALIGDMAMADGQGSGGDVFTAVDTLSERVRLDAEPPPESQELEPLGDAIRSLGTSIQNTSISVKDADAAGDSVLPLGDECAADAGADADRHTGGGGFIDQFFAAAEEEGGDGMTGSNFDSHQALGSMIEDAGSALAADISSVVPTADGQAIGGNMFTAKDTLSEPEQLDDEPPPEPQELEPLGDAMGSLGTSIQTVSPSADVSPDRRNENIGKSEHRDSLTDEDFNNLTDALCAGIDRCQANWTAPLSPSSRCH